MRQILVDQARRKASQKHGGNLKRTALSEAEPMTVPDGTTDILELDAALVRLQRTDERKARIVMLRYFAGLSNEDTAVALDLSVRTVEREWRFARALLFSWLSEKALLGREENADGPGKIA
jgi:RNA polymerase sigma factor (TIGR02999 family)